MGIENIKSDEEILDYMLSIFFSENEYPKMMLELFQDALPHVNYLDIERLFRKLKWDGFIVEFPKIPLVYNLSDKGMAIMRKHGTYLAYLASLEAEDKKVKRQEKIDRGIRNGNIIAALLISLCTLILTQCPTKHTQEQQKIESALKSVSNELDSLKQVLQHNKVNKDSLGK